MVIAVVLLGTVLLIVSVRRLRRPSPGNRWPFVTSAILSSVSVVLSGGGALVALTVGRTTWNAWTAGTSHRESITLSLAVVGFPLLLALAVVFVVVGSLSDGRLRRGGARRTHQST